jgi:hypothetical protein
MRRLKAKMPALLALITGALAQAGEPELSPKFYPGLDQYSDAQIRLHGLAALYPGKVLFEAPTSISANQRTEAARIEDLARDIKYIRIYRLDEAIVAIREHAAHPSLILDFRYVKSPGTASALASLLNGANELHAPTTLGEVPDSITDELEALNSSSVNRSHPAIVLCNRETAGPFEAILYNSQKQGSIIAVGERTAGQTGFYQKIESLTWMIEGELRPETYISLVATGFTPRIQVKVTAEENYSAYNLYEAGTPINRLLRNEYHNNKTASPAEQQADETPTAHDRILQRGVDIATALQVLQ